jgi:hypothetical protein
MKKFIFFILFVAAGVFVYLKVNPGNPIELKDNIETTKENNFDIDAPSPTPLYKAKVKGKAKNTSDMILKNVSIEYNIGGKIVTANIGQISPGQEIEFSTEQVIARSYNPYYKMDKINYEKIDPDENNP